MRKLLKSKKALSPVVAAIILIAVTVAVSIAVAAWMGSLTIGFMETSELTVVEVLYPDATHMNVTVTNSGTSDVSIAQVRINGATQSTWNLHTASDTTIAAGATDYVEITYTWTAGNKYAISFFATDGTMIGSYTDTA
jgi:flagellin-like protein